jgi:hypothetical protein
VRPQLLPCSFLRKLDATNGAGISCLSHSRMTWNVGTFLDSIIDGHLLTVALQEGQSRTEREFLRRAGTIAEWTRYGTKPQPRGPASGSPHHLLDSSPSAMRAVESASGEAVPDRLRVSGHFTTTDPHSSRQPSSCQMNGIVPRFGNPAPPSPLNRSFRTGKPERDYASVGCAVRRFTVLTGCAN